MQFRPMRVFAYLWSLTAAACSSDLPDSSFAIGQRAGSKSASAGSGGRNAHDSAAGGTSGASAVGSAGQAGRDAQTVSGSGGMPGGGRGGASGGGPGGARDGAGGAATMPQTLARFSFFLTSLEAMQRLSGSQDGFGGDLRHGEQDGLSGADKICTQVAEDSMPGASVKRWRAFLSVSEGPEGQAVHAIDRVGDGPWYDRVGRLLAMTRADLLNARPKGADPAIVDDLPNELGVPNHAPDPSMEPLDNHHVLTGSTAEGLVQADGTCDDWTSSAPSAGRPRVGFSWPAMGRGHWISGQDEGGCGAGILLEEQGGSNPDNPIVGSGGGYGGIYCFALMP